MSLHIISKMWTAYKALYLKQGPLEEFSFISGKMGQQFFWKLSHFEDIPWDNYLAENIIKALKVYYFEPPSVDPKSTKLSKSKKGEKEWIPPKITRGN